MTEPKAEGNEKFRSLRSSRRGFMGWMGKVGLTAVGGVAAVLATDKAAEADVRPQANWNCCNLYYSPPNCPLDAYGQPICHKGSLQVWYCCSGSAPWQRKYACGECTGGSSCGQGPFYCSSGWTVRANGC
ncbi:hypothetical protein [Fodinicola feengrottensis]|uniref:Twin-arginine translocation signal domain-containing protein n=1 Tax=Fodinicola feengrottensis TaxID=435914 RepID=A0ABN2H5X7_9ACTN|nr:hypothetical protein [Fodinicola feengrottensis]